jgi:hypothetical protein
MICTQVLAHSFSAWAALPHMSAQEKREVEYKNEVEQLRQQAAAAAGEKLAQAAEQLKVSHKQLYEAEKEKDKQALREQVIRSLLIYSRSLLTYSRSLLTMLNWQAERDKEAMHSLFQKQKQSALADLHKETEAVVAEKIKLVETLQNEKAQSAQEIQMKLEHTEQAFTLKIEAIEREKVALKEVVLKEQRTLEKEKLARQEAEKNLLRDLQTANAKMRELEEEFKGKLEATYSEAQVRQV